MYRKWENIVKSLERQLKLHHKLYSIRCKSELWEEISARALRETGYGSDWLPDFNHFIGTDQTTDDGINISNKSGLLNKNNTKMKISGSRTTKYKTIEEKLCFLENKSEDFIFCLAINPYEWKKGKRIYYFIVIDAKKLDYHKQKWNESYSKKGELTGWNCVSEYYNSKITISMSHQLWTDISSDMFEEIYSIDCSSTV